MIRVTITNLDGDVFDVFTRTPKGTWVDSVDEQIASDDEDFERFALRENLGVARKWAEKGQS